MKELYNESSIYLKIFIWFTVGIIFAMILDITTGTTIEYNGIIIDKYYKSERSSSGSGTVITTNGQVGFVSMSSYEPEEYNIIVKSTEDRVFKIKCSASTYYIKEINDNVTCNRKIGSITNTIYTNKIID